MTASFTIKSLMLRHILDYLEPGGVKKIRNQQIEILDGLAFVARCSPFKGSVLFEFSLGLGASLAQMCLSYLNVNFKLESLKTVRKPFLDWSNNLSNFSVLTPESIDQKLSNILSAVELESKFACDYFFRLFEYSLGYIVLHELGHYLNGHTEYFSEPRISLDSPYYSYYIRERHMAELQADIFATQLILNKNVFVSIAKTPSSITSFKEVGDPDWETCVTHAIFISFILLEELETNTPGRLHPPAIYRIINSAKHIIGSGIFADSNNTLTKFENRLLSFFDYAGSFGISTADWTMSLYNFWGNADDSAIQSNSNAFEVIRLQIDTAFFRKKLVPYSVRALELFSSDIRIFKLIVLSGKHIPWQMINTESFYHSLPKLIDFSNRSVVYAIHSSKDQNLIKLLEEMTKSKEINNHDFSSVIASMNNIMNMETIHIMELIGDHLLTSRVIQINEEATNIAKISVAQHWMDKFKELLKDTIRNSSTFKYYVQETAEFSPSLIFSIADLIEKICVGVPPYIVSVLILKKGLKEFVNE